MSETIDYFSDWESRVYKCKCGWSGSGAALSRELFAELLGRMPELFQLPCPCSFSDRR